ncbi:uncharacterized protein LOC143213491 [Lasioglossum baleicum]|uniref:uncharacterized protein LOC143213491 n=1 Tax=Lasioglossum baleicum TaxID=434251 RepID=UPI003FCC7493
MPGYVCVVPGCKSGWKVPAHGFPKDPVRALQWKEAVNSPRLDGLFGHELKKFYVCALHFTEDDVIPSLVRRKLKQDAIPSLLLQEMCVDSPEDDTALNLQQEDKEAEDAGPSSLLPKQHHAHDVEDAAEQLGTHLQEEMCVDSPEDDTALNLQQEDKEAKAEMSITKRRRKNAFRYRIPTTMTSNSKQFFDIAKQWKNQLYNARKKLKSYKMRLASANKFIRDNGLTGYRKLNPAQQLFLQMQLSNMDRKAK